MLTVQVPESLPQKSNLADGRSSALSWRGTVNYAALTQLSVDARHLTGLYAYILIILVETPAGNTAIRSVLRVCSLSVGPPLATSTKPLINPGCASLKVALVLEWVIR